MSKVFISYRREDSADIAGRIYDYLTPPLGPFQRDDVFKDVDTIPLGVNFKTHLEAAVAQCAVQLVVIGPRWLTTTNEAGQRRLDDPRDFVRIEVETALKRGVPVIPLLVMGALMPGEHELPDSLSELSLKNGTSVRRDPDFKGDMARLIKAVEQWLSQPRPAPKRTHLFTLPMLEWLDIPAGKVTLKEDAEIYSVEPFAISKYPVTYAQFETFLNAPDGYRNDRWWEGLAQRDKAPSEQTWKIDSHPREHVNWYEALAFARWLGAKMQTNVSLPTEAQWQWAAQGRDGRKFPWGKNFDNARCNTMESGIGRTTPVDQYPNGASAFAVMDMAGNVWEWCLNKAGNHPDTAVGGKPSRVLRGGSWLDPQNSARAVFRNSGDPANRYNSYGFRVVISSAVPNPSYPARFLRPLVIVSSPALPTGKQSLGSALPPDLSTLPACRERALRVSARTRQSQMRRQEARTASRSSVLFVWFRSSAVRSELDEHNSLREVSDLNRRHEILWIIIEFYRQISSPKLELKSSLKNDYNG